MRSHKENRKIFCVLCYKKAKGVKHIREDLAALIRNHDIPTPPMITQRIVLTEARATPPALSLQDMTQELSDLFEIKHYLK